MALSPLSAFGVAPPIQHEDIYKVRIDKGAGVTFCCKNRNTTIQGVLAAPISLSSSAKWESFLGSAGALVNAVDTVEQAFAGVTINQPWMGRCAYQGTDPMRLDITVDFSTSVGNPLGIAGTHDAYKEVYVPAMELIGLTVPRAGSGDGVLGEMNEKATSLFEKIKSQLGGLSSSAAGKLSSFDIRSYIVPGPTLTMDSGDDTIVVIGNILYLKYCYITNVTLAVDNVFDAKGYPTHIQAKVSVQAADKPYMLGTKFYESNAVGFTQASGDTGASTTKGNGGVVAKSLSSTVSKVKDKVVSAIGQTKIGSKIVKVLGWTPQGSSTSSSAFGPAYDRNTTYTYAAPVSQIMAENPSFFRK